MRSNLTDSTGRSCPRWRSVSISALLAIISLLASAEFFSFLFLRYGVEQPWRPAYLAAPVRAQRVGAWLTEHREFGVWHVPDAQSRHEGACFSVAMRANADGARDVPRARDSAASRVVVLGDSFAEGWGVEEADRFSNIMERRLGREFLNFGAATMGPLQYQIVYEKLASGFTHDTVLLMFLADNDFTDNDLGFWKGKVDGGGRYRPYYEKTAGGYVAYYPPRDTPAGTPREPDPLRRLGDVIKANSWAVAAWHYAAGLIGGRYSYAGYFDYTKAQLDAVLWSFREIKRMAGPRRMIVAIIPRPNDFARVARGGESPLPGIFRAFGAANDIAFVDLLPAMSAHGGIDLYIPCDGHWSVDGNRIAAEALIASGLLGPQK